MSLPQWKGLFDWSIKYQDGTAPSNWDPKDYNPEKMKWLEGVLKHYMQDFAGRMRQINASLQTGQRVVDAESGDDGSESTSAEQADDKQEVQHLSLEDKEALLDELMDIVSSIDFARDLHKIGGLSTLLDILDSNLPSLRWRAAEVAATCMQNNPPVQKWFLDGGILPRILALLDEGREGEPWATLRVKGLLCASALMRHYTPGLEAVRLAAGLTRLAKLAADPDRRVHRKAFALLQYCVSHHRPDAKAVLVSDALPAILRALGDTDEAGRDARASALELLVEMAYEKCTWAALKENNQLLGALQQLAQAHAGLSGDDADAAREEVQARTTLESLLSASQPPAAPSHVSDHVDVGYDQGHGEPLTLPVNQPVGEAGVGVTGGSGAGSRQGSMPLGLPAP